MIAPTYGSLPVAHDTGGIHDTIVPLDAGRGIGNGFLFEIYDANGLFWAIRQAMAFYALPGDTRERHIRRIMREAAASFNHAVTARQYIDLYETMLQRPLLRCDPPPQSFLDTITAPCNRPHRREHASKRNGFLETAIYDAFTSGVGLSIVGNTVWWEIGRKGGGYRTTGRFSFSHSRMP
jgi:hypothetical protein